jgi:acyl carrier protein
MTGRKVYSDEEIFKEVKGAIIEALGIAEDKITMDAKMVDDLGAESLDFIDVVFRLEKKFLINLPKDNFLEKAMEVFGDGILEKDGVLTDMGLEVLKYRMPEADLSSVEGAVALEEVSSFFTVRTWVRVVKESLSNQPSNCKKCNSGKLDFDSELGKLKCADCGEEITQPSGSELTEKWVKDAYKKYVKKGG